MSKVIILRGLPGSGKTTWAKEYQKEHPKTKRVNRDELRAMLDDSVWSKSNEKFVVEAEEFLIMSSLIDGYIVIIDDTNLSEKSLRRWRETVNQHNIAEKAKVGGGNPVDLEVKEFDTSLEECISRDAKRTGRARVGEGVIRRFHNDHYANQTKNKS